MGVGRQPLLFPPERMPNNNLDVWDVGIYPVRHCATFLYADRKQNYIMPFKLFENGLSHGVYRCFS